MKAGALCIRDVATATTDESVVDAAQRMAEFHVSELIVVERSSDLLRPIGIVSDRDLVVRVLTRADRAPATVAVAEVMRCDLVTATEDDDVERGVALMREHTLRRIPIVDRHGGLQGVLRLDDVLGWMREQIEVVSQLLDRLDEGPPAPGRRLR